MKPKENNNIQVKMKVLVLKYFPFYPLLTKCPLEGHYSKSWILKCNFQCIIKKKLSYSAGRCTWMQESVSLYKWIALFVLKLDVDSHKSVFLSVLYSSLLVLYCMFYIIGSYFGHTMYAMKTDIRFTIQICLLPLNIK